MIMYIIARVLKVEKGQKAVLQERFSQPFRLQTIVGFVKREVWIDEKNPQFDLIRIQIYWESREAFYAWEGSEEHKALHKGGKGHGEMPGVIESTKETYFELATVYAK
ncbi:antibiotic biosynthesis monooxygenase [Paracholeplasma manati]|uniref:Antibiotic biosynthesis monooxygenase n=1 Tax=Paracholeplasma manati TaxID=591373 RepID=A0ABT2Y7M6_9MOLU|nr:antibiotic biosynthesis monooxygenase [Paracholeplasma manati]MCV2232752.1 antibiotic biosynthesis monooxygenase [Paracholeplasma manati]MDG0887940.1 antibiotic biosynthesis monooxygenase [Paracholeplasma manati]